MLLAEDLLLLLTDDTTGRLAVPRAPADAALGGAVLAELALMGKVDLTGETDPGKPWRLAVYDPSQPVTRCSMPRWRSCWRTKAGSRPR